jgi:hypothetical protein
MAELLDGKELVTFKEMMMANSIQVDALAQLLIEKRFITEDEFYDKLKQVQIDYESKGKGKAG